jgi:peptide/nickel transport system ATP-binding protein
MTEAPLLTVDDLVVRFHNSSGTTHAVNGVSFSVGRGETIGIVGESGCGKSATSLSILRLLPKPAGRIEGGRIMFDGSDLLARSESEMREIRGRDVAMIFQDPMTSLNPVLTIGEQLVETIRAHTQTGEANARRKAAELLSMVGIADAENALRCFPHQFSGGMRQRAMIAMALALEPKLLIADEPTTALDVTVQAQVLDLLKQLTKARGTSTILITHDLGVVAGMTDRINVMYAGYVVETCSTANLFGRPSHPYTVGLLHSIPRRGATDGENLVPIEGRPPDQRSPPVGCPFTPRCAWRLPLCAEKNPVLAPIDRMPQEGHSIHLIACHNPPTRDEATAGRPLPDPAPAQVERREDRSASAESPHAGEPPLLEVRNLKVYFPIRAGAVFGRHVGDVHAVDDVSFEVRRRETLGLVGESGSGKSTTGRALLRLSSSTGGTIRFGGEDITALEGESLRGMRRRMQMIFQDPFSSLNPRMTVGGMLAEPFEVHDEGGSSAERRERVAELLALVGLPRDAGSRYPHEFSGGQRQRVGIARALALSPDLIVADEPISALDVSIQAQIVNLLRRLQDSLGLSYVLIAHDLTVVSHISHRIAVMYLGRIVELASSRELNERPLHPYTVALLSAVPVADPGIERLRRRIILKGDIPSAANPPRGCRFQARCWMRERLGNPERCVSEDPLLTEVSAAHRVACHFAADVDNSPEQRQALAGRVSAAPMPQVN